MPDVTCHKTGCTFTTRDVSDAMAATIMGHHLLEAHPIAAPPKAPTFKAPELASGITSEQWESFKLEWDVYMESAAVPTARASAYLLNCCDQALKATIQKEDPTFTTKKLYKTNRRGGAIY